MSLRPRRCERRGTGPGALLRRGLLVVLLAVLLGGMLSRFVGAARAQELPASDEALANRIEQALHRHVLAPWYPKAVDTRYGGYLTQLSADWTPFGAQEKMIVTQARHVWTLSRAAEFTGREAFARWAGSGARFLGSEMWDPTYGGFYWLVDRSGEPMGDRTDGGPIKRAYGQAFALYGLAAYVRVTGDSAALELAKEGFRWLERHSHDPEYGGYFQFLRRDGTPFPDGYEGTPPKDQNSSIHLLEAFTELYHVWPAPLLEERLQEMLVLVRDTMVSDRGHLHLFFRRDWEPISYRDSSDAVREAHFGLDHVSFGHDIETAYLLLEADAALGGGVSPRTRSVARRLLTGSVRHGWDHERGGLYDGGLYVLGTDSVRIFDDGKAWWAQVEALNSLLLGRELLPDERGRYDRLFRAQWRYIEEYLLDHERSGFYGAGLDTRPDAVDGAKGHVWKGSYHTARSLMNVVEGLRGQ